MKCAASLMTETLSLVALLTLGAGGHAQAPDGAAVALPTGVVAPFPQADGTWRAVVVDKARETLLLLNPTDPTPVPLGPAGRGFILEPRDPSRLVFLRYGPQTTATIFSQAPARTLGPVPLGACKPTPVSGQRDIVDVPGRLIFSCEGMLVSLDLERGTTATQPASQLTRSPELHLLDADRLLAVETGRRDRPFTTELRIYDARTLALGARAKVHGLLRSPALVSGGRELVLIDIGEPWLSDSGDEIAQGPTTLRYFDVSTATETRTVSLGAPFKNSRMSADGRFVYATNMDYRKPKQTARELRIIRVETGEVLETVSLLEHASWFDPLMRDPSLPAMIEDRRWKEPALSRLLILDEGHVRARLPMHNYAHQVLVDHKRGRMYLLDEQSLAVYAWPDLRLEKRVVAGKTLKEPHMSLAPGATRTLVVAGGRALAVDLATGTALPEAKLGSSGAGAQKFWGNVPKVPCLASMGAGCFPGPWILPGQRGGPVQVAFSADGRRAMVPAPTGQITTIDMTSGRALSHVPGGDGAIAFAGVPLAIAADKQASWVLNVATGDVVARFTVPAADADARLSASVSPDGHLVLIGRGAAVHLLEAATGRPVQEWTGFGRIGEVRFLRDVPPPW